MAFSVETFDLSLNNSVTGTPLTANVYRVEGIDRQLSIGELVMAICLNSATELERQIVEKMEASARNTAKLEKMTALQTALVAWQSETQEAQATGTATISRNVVDLARYVEGIDLDGYDDWIAYLTDEETIGLKLSITEYGGEDGFSYDQISSLIEEISSGMDSLNTVSQSEMIDLQVLTNRRDERYNLISNVAKSFNTVLISNANNL